MVRVCSSIRGDRSGLTLSLIALVVDSIPACWVLHMCSIARLLCHAYELICRCLSPCRIGEICLLQPARFHHRDEGGGCKWAKRERKVTDFGKYDNNDNGW